MPQKDSIPAKAALDTVIKKSRVHFYKPIQIAEILYQHRTGKISLDLGDLTAYRNISKRWRDQVTVRLIGRRSTSSARYQDNLFEENAMTPKSIAALGEMNKSGKGFVEAYIYKSLQARLNTVYLVEEYIRNATPETFSVRDLVELFVQNPGLRRSIDKMYEIGVYALFTTIVRALDAQVTIMLGNEDKAILSDFEGFIKTVIGIDAKHTQISMPAALYRVGVTNAADRGLDMWANFGAAIQVKHLTLTPELVEDIASGISADKIVIVCLKSEQEKIKALLKQVGWGDKIQGIITLDDLDTWYKLCLSKTYRKKLGATLLKDILTEFNAEFPSSAEINPFLKERGYDRVKMPQGWELI